MIDVTTLPVNKQFSRRLVKPDSWIINCYDPNLAAPHPHVLIGDKYALVIDTTNTKLNLRKYLEEYVTDKPFKVASTHSHFDHTLANGQFNDCPIYMSEIAWQEIQMVRAHPTEREKGYILGDYVPILVKEGDIIELGYRNVEVIKFSGCHSPSSVAYLDKKYGILFTGDELESGQVLIMGSRGNNSVELLHENLLHLKERAGEFDMICPPHNGSPMHAKMLDYFIENCERIMSGIEGEHDVASMSYLLNPLEDRPPEKVAEIRSNPINRRSEWMGSSIVYSLDKVFKNQNR